MKAIYWPVCCLFLLLNFKSTAQLISLDAQNTNHLLGKNLAYFSCGKNELSIAQIIASGDSIKFNTNTSDLLLLHESEYKTDLWIRFSICNKTTAAQAIIVDVNNSLIDHIEFYDTKQHNILHQQQTGDEYPANSRMLAYRGFAFRIQVNPGDTHTVYFKFEMDGRKIHLPIIVQLEDKFVERVAQKELGLGIYYGILLVISVLFFYLFYLIKDKAFLYFAGYMSTHTLSQLAVSGVANIYMWPWASFWADRCVLFFMALSISLGLGFVVAFITQPKFKPWFLYLIRGFQFLALLAALGSFGNNNIFNIAVWLNYKLIPPFYILMFLVAASFYINKYVPARIFILGYIAAITSICGLLYIAYFKKHENVFTNNVVILGEICKTVLLSFALLDRLKIFKEEKELAQLQVIQQLEELNRYKEVVNSELEETVERKSKELIEKQNEVKRALISGEEKERKRVAQELHDGMGSLLSTLRLNAEAIDLSDKNLDEKETIAYQNVLEMIDKACTELRTISHNMLPSGIEHFGLVATLQSLIKKINHTSQVQFSLQVIGLEQFHDSEMELHIYRIVLELINNTIKHAQAKQVIIQLVRNDNYLSVLMEDDGIGFDTTQQITKGIGLLSLRSRVEALNGQFQIDSRIHHGTTITIEIPLS